MGTIGLTLLIFIIALMGLIYVSNLYTQYMITKIVVRKMEWLDFIQITEVVPPEWRTRHEKAFAKLSSADEAKMSKLKTKARKDYLHRMDKLIHFAKVCTLVASEVERADILKSLASIRQNWVEHDEALFETR